MSTLARVLAAGVAVGAVVVVYLGSRTRPAPPVVEPASKRAIETWAELGVDFGDARAKSDSERSYTRLGIARVGDTWDLRDVTISVRREFLGRSTTEITCDGYGNVELDGSLTPGGPIGATLNIDPLDLLPVLDALEDMDFFAVAEPRFALPSHTELTTLTVRCGDRSRTLDSMDTRTTPSQTTPSDRIQSKLQRIASAFDRAVHASALMALAEPEWR